MNTEKLQEKLIRAARTDVPSEAVPYLFEKRVIERILQQPVLDSTAAWAAGLWRAAVGSVAIALVCSGLHMNTAEFSEDFTDSDSMDPIELAVLDSPESHTAGH